MIYLAIGILAVWVLLSVATVISYWVWSSDSACDREYQKWENDLKMSYWAHYWDYLSPWQKFRINLGLWVKSVRGG